MARVRELLVKITGDGAELEKALDRSARRIDAVGRRFQKVGRGLTAGITAPILAAGAGILALIHRTSEYADEIDKMSIRTGIGRETLQELAFVAGQTGVEFTSLEGVISSFTRRIPQIRRGTGPAAEAFARLGVRLEDTDGQLRGMGDLFPEIVGGLSRMENATERNAVATQIFGRRAMEIVPILDRGGAEVEALMNRVHELGGVMSDAEIRDFVGFKDALGEIQVQLRGVGQTVAGAFLPVLQREVIPMLRDRLLPTVREWAVTLRGVDAETIKTVASAAGLLALLGPLAFGIGSVVRTAAAAIQMLSLLAGVKAGLGALLLPGGLLLAGLALLTYNFIQNKIAAAEAAIEIARLRGEYAALSDEQRQLRMVELHRDLDEAARKLQEAKGAARAFREEQERAPGFLGLGTRQMEGRLELVRDMREARERVEELQQKLGALGDAMEMSAEQRRAMTRAMEEAREEAEKLMSAQAGQTEETRTAADVMGALSDELRVAATLHELLGDGVNRGAMEMSALDKALRDLVMHFPEAEKEIGEVVERLDALRAEQRQAAADTERLTDAQRMAAAVLAETHTPAERYRQTVEALNVLLEAGRISQEQFNAAVERARALFEDSAEGLTTLDQALGHVAASGSAAFADMALQGEMSIKRFVDASIAHLARLAAQFAAFKGLSAIFPTSGFVTAFGRSLGFLQHGGAAQAHRPYVVGEAGPELFVPRSSGHVVPNSALGGDITLRLDTSSLPPRPRTLTPDAAANDDWWRRAFSALAVDHDDRGGR